MCHTDMMGVSKLVKAELAFFPPTCLFNKTKAPTMDKVHGNNNGVSFTTSLCVHVED